VLESRPIYTCLCARSAGDVAAPRDLVTGLAGAAAVCLLATFLPLLIALRRLDEIER